MKQSIYIQQWLELKAYKIQQSTDRYYLEISNKVNVILGKEIKLFAVFLAFYLDLIITNKKSILF